MMKAEVADAAFRAVLGGAGSLFKKEPGETMVKYIAKLRRAGRKPKAPSIDQGMMALMKWTTGKGHG